MKKQPSSRGGKTKHASIPEENSVHFLKISTVVSIWSVMRLRCTLMFPVQNMGEYAAKSQWVKLLLHVSAGNRLWSQLWIGPLHTDYFKALIIHQGRREAKREEVKKKSLLVLLSLSLTDVTMHTGALNMLSLVWPRAILYIYKALHYFLQLAAYEWCARD